MNDNYFAVIMAGGGGTRLWPLSRKEKPKQMIRLFNDRTLFQVAIDRLNGLFPPDHIFVVTVSEQASELQVECPQIPKSNFIIEPMPRGTASVIGLAAVALEHIRPDAVMAVLTADHYIGDEKLFRNLLLTAHKVADENFLVTLGIKPTYPATGYGYIQKGEKIGIFDGRSVYSVKKFKEKPNKKNAEKMIETNDHVWNSGMFIWQVNNILSEIALQMPELFTKLKTISGSWESSQREESIEKIWETLIPETIDYGVMENAEHVAVIPAADLDWHDVGSWDSLFEILHQDEDGNVVLARENMRIDTKNTLLFDKGKKKLIVTIGSEDLIIVDTGDVLFVCNRGESQRVREVVKKLKEEMPDYL